MTTSIRLDEFKASFESISLLTGEAFFKNVVKAISSSLAVDAVWIAELHKEQNSMTTLAFIYSGDYRPDFTYLLDGTPCEQVINASTFLHYSDRLVDYFLLTIRCWPVLIAKVTQEHLSMILAEM